MPGSSSASWMHFTSIQLVMHPGCTLQLISGSSPQLDLGPCAQASSSSQSSFFSDWSPSLAVAQCCACHLHLTLSILGRQTGAVPLKKALSALGKSSVPWSHEAVVLAEASSRRLQAGIYSNLHFSLMCKKYSFISLTKAKVKIATIKPNKDHPNHIKQQKM